MSKFSFTCKICRKEFDMPNYGDADCPRCGQSYEYDEDHRMVLRDAQLSALRKFRGVIPGVPK